MRTEVDNSVLHPVREHHISEPLQPSSESIYKVARRIKQCDNSLYNALRSVHEDSGFVAEIRALWPELPVLANLRCGLWYAPKFDGLCYFKSTDGHTGNWSFSATRLNIHVATLAAQGAGCMIVDATRKGKRFPDSMSKTIPIWACVINRAVADLRESATSASEREHGNGTCTGAGAAVAAQGEPDSQSEDLQAWDRSVHLPLWVSATEKANIEKRINEWVDKLKETGADLAPLVASLKKPLQPLWISQKSLIWLNEVPDASDWPFTPLILVSASVPTSCPTRMSDGEYSWTYIPGAADDEESWARGLTPALFWENVQDIIGGGPGECKKRVIELVEKDRVKRGVRGQEAPQIRVRPSLSERATHHHVQVNNMCGVAAGGAAAHCLSSHQDCDDDAVDSTRFCQTASAAQGVRCIGTTGLGIGTVDIGLNSKVLEAYSCIINCAASTDSLNDEPNNLSLQILGSKFDRHSLQTNLGAVTRFAKDKLDDGKTILILCSDGEDVSVCVCLAILLACFDMSEVGPCEKGVHRRSISKSNVRQGLRFISAFHPHARPSRGNLKQVFNYFLDQQL